MSGCLDLMIVKYVIKKMALPRHRPVKAPWVIQMHIDRSLKLIFPAVPSQACQHLLSNYLKERNATSGECLQAWALYLDYKTMAKLYGLQSGMASRGHEEAWLSAAS